MKVGWLARGLYSSSTGEWWRRGGGVWPRMGGVAQARSGRFLRSSKPSPLLGWDEPGLLGSCVGGRDPGSPYDPAGHLFLGRWNTFCKSPFGRGWSTAARDFLKACLRSPTERGHEFERMRTAIRANVDSVSSERGHFGGFVVMVSAIVGVVSTIVGTVSTIVGIAV